MAYTRTVWKPRQGTNLGKFTKHQETAEAVVLVNEPDVVTEPGTPFSADNMNHIEEGIEEAHLKLDSAPTLEDMGALVDAEARARTEGDTALVSAISNEAETRDRADSGIIQTIRSLVSAEAQERLEADQNLYDQITTLMPEGLENLPELLNQKAPTNHASSSATYGAGDDTIYGHVKLNTSTLPVANGSALVGTSGKAADAGHVHPTDITRAPLNSPALTGTPTAPTVEQAANNTQIATTAYVRSAIDAIVQEVLEGMKIINNRLEFTSDGAFLVPPEVTRVYITACGGGGWCSNSNGGGGAACIVQKEFPVIPGTVHNITIGLGGYNNTKKNGEATVIADLVTLPGGGGGTSSGGGVSGGVGGGVGGKYNSDTENGTYGTNGAVGFGGKGARYSGGGGGGSYGGGGGINSSLVPNSGGYGGISKSDGSHTTGYGGYGAGGGYVSGSNTGKGGDGIVIIEW